jgi:hypothetical protein
LTNLEIKIGFQFLNTFTILNYLFCTERKQHIQNLPTEPCLCCQRWCYWAWYLCAPPNGGDVAEGRESGKSRRECGPTGVMEEKRSESERGHEVAWEGCVLLGRGARKWGLGVAGVGSGLRGWRVMSDFAREIEGVF